MSAKSKIEWTDATWTPIRARNRKTGKVGWHCEHATPGCVNCYAESMNARLGTGLPFKPGHRADVELFLDEEMLTAPLRWKRPRMVFVCSMTDLFADFVPDAWIDRVFAVMALAPQHTFQVLTKRAERMRDYLGTRSGDWTEVLPEACPPGTLSITKNDVDRAFGRAAKFSYDPPTPTWPLRNVWLGVSAEDQRRADERIPHLLATPAAVRFISAEPLLGPIDLTDISGTACLALEGACCGDRPWLDALHGIQGCSRAGAYAYPGRGQMPRGIDWVIVGGESGRGARPMHPDWARALRDQCEAGVAFFFKQWGAYLPWTQFSAAGIEDHPEITRFDTMEWEEGCWNDVGRPMWCDSVDGNIDDEQCVALVGKKAAGRLLDGVEYNGMPQVRP